MAIKLTAQAQIMTFLHLMPILNIWPERTTENKVEILICFYITERSIWKTVQVTEAATAVAAVEGSVEIGSAVQGHLGHHLYGWEKSTMSRSSR
jgi:hypothetical protein